MITLTLKEPPTVPLEAESFSPDVMAASATTPFARFPSPGQAAASPRRLLRGRGRGQRRAHDPRRPRPKVKWIGRGMTRGRITVVGNAGMHLGAYMKGGAIEVTGNVVGLAGRRDVRRPHPRPRQRGRPGRGRLSGKPQGDEPGDDPDRGLGRHRSRHAHAARHHRRRRPRAGLRRAGDEGWHDLPAGRRRDPDRRLDVRGTIVSLAPIHLLPTFTYACAYQPDVPATVRAGTCEHSAS